MKISKHWIRRGLGLFFLGTAALFLPASGFAVDRIVGNNSDNMNGSLRDTIVNIAQDGDTVIIPNTIGQITLTNGNILISKNITIQGAGAGTTVIDGNDASPVFVIGSGTSAKTVTIRGVTIQRGKFSNPMVLAGGGGILQNPLTTLILEDSRLANNNSATSGGGISAFGAFTRIVRSTIEGNSAGTDGGGINCSRGEFELIDSTVFNNTATDGAGISSGHDSGGFCTMRVQGTILGTAGCNITENTATGSGGGIWVDDPSDTSINTCTISGNTAKNGGGVLVSALAAVPHAVTISNSVINGNHALGTGSSGGGIRNHEGDLRVDNTTISNNDTDGNGGAYAVSSGNDTISNTTISNNHAQGVDSNGGGIYYQASIGATPSMTISNTTIFGNDATGSGGGIFNASGVVRPNLNNVTIARNTADSDQNNVGDGGGVAGGTSLEINNTLIADNSDASDTSAGGEVHPDCTSTLNSQGHNLIGILTGCNVIGSTTGNIINQPAGLDPSGLQANGSTGPMTVALLDGSRALGAADPATATATDQRGVARPQPLGSLPDIGAFESDASPPVSPTPIPSPTSNPTPTSSPVTPAPSDVGVDDGSVRGGGCSLTPSRIRGIEGISLLFLAPVGFVAWRRRASSAKKATAFI